jgi:hypothetical protein
MTEEAGEANNGLSSFVPQLRGSQGERKMGCFRSSEGFSQAISLEERPRLILLLFGGIPNSP